MIATYSLNMFKCNLCEEVILAEHKSSTCPFCGAHDEYIIRAQDWSGEDISKNMSQKTKENMAMALEFELENTRFYRCAASHAQKTDKKSIFQSLVKIEMQHVSIISKLLKKPSLAPSMLDICFRFDAENVIDSLNREKRSKDFYQKAYNEATEAGVKSLLFGLIEVEGDHVELLRERIE
ncbi:ferritin family protein [Patescibacteria group bacterium]|nr:ferritin family protein [Patescibacteria group bacterium]